MFPFLHRLSSPNSRPLLLLGCFRNSSLRRPFGGCCFFSSRLDKRQRPIVAPSSRLSDAEEREDDLDLHDGLFSQGGRRGGFSELDGKPVPLLRNMSRQALYDLWIRLRENDVDYGDMKHLCKDNGLGGKDMKHNLRAKLLRQTRELLGMKVWDPEDYPDETFKRPDEMSDEELQDFFDEREVHMPDDITEAVHLALAMLAVDGVIDASQVPNASNYEKFAVAELKSKCRKRGLPSNGNKQELIQRLQDYDNEREKRELMERAFVAAQQELDRASIYSPPRPPNYSLEKQLRRVQASMAAITTMKLPELRAALMERNLPVYGTREVLIERMTEVLRQDVVQAHAGHTRLIKYAAAAIRKLTPEEIYDELSMRGLFGYGTSSMEDSASRLASTLVDEWIQNALMGWTYGDEGEEEGIVEDEDLARDGREEKAGVAAISSMDVVYHSDEKADEGKVDTVKTGINDPTLEVVLLCCGAHSHQRERALRAARAILPKLQSDPVWGTLMPPFGSESIGMTSEEGGYGMESTDIDGESSGQPPAETVEISLLTPLANGVLVTLAVSGSPPPQTVYVVRATPLDSNESNVLGGLEGTSATPGNSSRASSLGALGDHGAVCAEGQDQNLVLQGLCPGTQYKFTAFMRNPAGEGPEGEPYFAASVVRQGICVTVLYEHAGSQLDLFASSTQGDSGSTDSFRYTRLSWEELHVCSAAELDARFRNAEGSVGLRLEDAIPPGAVVLPLGPPAFTNLQIQTESSKEASYDIITTMSHRDNTFEPGTRSIATNWADTAIRQCMWSRHAFCAKAHQLGYSTSPLLAIKSSDISSQPLEQTMLIVKDWFDQTGADPLVTRVAVRTEHAGEVMDAGLGRGIEEISYGVVSMLENGPADHVLLEMVYPGGIFFKVCVLETECGPIALSPTEYSYEDIDEELEKTDLELQRFVSVLEGTPPKKAEATMILNREGLRCDPAVLGGLVGHRAQRILTHTPPKSLPSDAVLSIRLAAAKLFQDLDLKDFAEFSGWLVPDTSQEKMDLDQAAASLRESSSSTSVHGSERNTGDDATQFPSSSNKSEESIDAPMPKTEEKFKGKSFAELQALAAQERQRLHEETSFVLSSSEVSDEEKLGALEIHNDLLPSELARYGAGPRDPIRYGEFIGITINDRTREDILSSMPSKDPVDRIPEALPDLSEPSQLPQLAKYASTDVCRIDTASYQGDILFNGLNVTPWLDSPVGILSQQAASAGIMFSALVRRMISAAATRIGLPAVPLGFNTDASDVYEEWPLDVSEKSTASENESASVRAAIWSLSLEDIEKEMESWGTEKAIPKPIEYDEIAKEAEGEGAFNDLEDAWLDPSLDELSFGNRELASSSGVRDQDRLGSFASGARGNDSRQTSPTNSHLSSSDPSSSEDVQAILSREYPGLHPYRQRVWVLFGGEGHDRDAGLSAAADVVASLQEEQDLLIEAFCLDPYDASKHDLERRRTLFQRRLELMKIGATDDEILRDMPEFHPTRVRHLQPPDPEDLRWRGVWRLSGTPIVKETVSDLCMSCEDALDDATTSFFCRRDGDRIHHRDIVTSAVASELRLAKEMVGGYAPWGGSLSSSNSTHHVPRYCFLEEWASVAASQCVVVLLVLPGHPIALGPLQQLLESKGVPYTGPSASSATLCADRGELLRYLEEGSQYDGSAIQVPPCHSISLPELSKQCATDDEANELFDRLFGQWEEKMLIIRPAKHSGGLGIARLGCGRDLRVYSAAVNVWADRIPNDVLRSEAEDVAMPVPPPTQFVIEPFVPATPITMTVSHSGRDDGTAVEREGAEREDEFYSRLQWPTDGNAWLEIRACLVGTAGSMRCLGLTTTVLELSSEEENEETSCMGTFDLTPPPPGILSTAANSEISFRLQLAADRLGLSGAAMMTALVNPSKLEIILVDVDPHPDTSRNGLLMKQAAVQPLTAQAPVEVLRDLLKVGMTRAEASSSGLGEEFNMEAVGEDMQFFSEDDFEAFIMSDDEGYMESSESSMLHQSYYGDPYLRVDWVSGEQS